MICFIAYLFFFFTKLIYLFLVTFGFCDDPENNSTTDNSANYNFGDVYVSNKPIPTCEEGQELAGGSVIQCVLGDNPNSTQWNDSLPYCRGEYLHV